MHCAKCETDGELAALGGAFESENSQKRDISKEHSIFGELIKFLNIHTLSSSYYQGENNPISSQFTFFTTKRNPVEGNSYIPTLNTYSHNIKKDIKKGMEPTAETLCNHVIRC